MNLKEFESDLNAKWNRNITWVSILSTIVVCISEIIIFFFNKSINSLDISYHKYIMIKIVLPSSINAAITLIMIISEHLKNLPFVNNHRDSFISIGFFLICSNIALVHNYYCSLWIIPCLCLFVCSMYSSRAQLKRITAYSFLVMLLSTFITFKEGEYENFYLLITDFCGIAFIITVYLASTFLKQYHEEQLNYMTNNYKRQLELMDELNIDSMTGLHNRSSLTKTVNNLMKEDSLSESNGLYLAMFDLDHFKNINDTYGHISGDSVIITFSKIIRDRLDDNSNGFRYGGEEFLILFKNTDLKHVMDTITDIRMQLAHTVFDFNKDILITFSAGISIYEAGLTDSELIDHADKALYDAKNNGRNRTEIYENH